MSINFFDGFDLYADAAGLAEQWGVLNTPTVDTNGGRFSQGAVFFNANADGIYYTDSVNQNFVTAGFSFKSNLADFVRCFAWADVADASTDNNMNAGIVILADGSIIAEGDSGINLGTSATGVISADTWHWIEIQIERAASGSIEVFVDGASVVSATGDTLESTTNSFFIWGEIQSNATDTYIDDIVIQQDASALPSTLGDSRISTLLPNADTAQADWSLSTGSNGFELIDDALGTNGDGDSTYISDTTNGNKSEFDLENLSLSPSTIHAVAANSRSSKTDAGAKTYRNYLDSSGTEGPGNSVDPTNGTYNLITDIFETDPNTASAWGLAGVNAVKLGVEITS